MAVDDRGRRGQVPWLALVIAALVVGAGLALEWARDPVLRRSVMDALTPAHPTDGTWMQVLPDGGAVPPDTGRVIALRAGALRGGNDACNSFGVQPDGTNVSTLVGCPEQSPTHALRPARAGVRDGYHLRADGDLDAVEQGFVLRYRRCGAGTDRVCRPG